MYSTICISLLNTPSVTLSKQLTNTPFRTTIPVLRMPKSLLGIVTMVTVAASYWLPPQESYVVDEDYCSTGPPGIYCQSDLLGYYDCRIDPHTGTYYNKTHDCRAGTRYVIIPPSQFCSRKQTSEA